MVAYVHVITIGLFIFIITNKLLYCSSLSFTRLHDEIVAATFSATVALITCTEQEWGIENGCRCRLQNLQD